MKTASTAAAQASNWLLDGSIYFFRGYFGMPQTLLDDAGEPCGGVHGFARALVEVLSRHPNRPGAVAFDESLGTCFRNQLFGEYKANRAPPDDNIIHQFAHCVRLCDLLGVANYASQRFEADDLLASLASRSRNRVVIYSSDKDLRQLVNVKCEVKDLKSESGFTAQSFAATYGFKPALFPDYQALVGDTSDNVPGVPGFGPKTAQKLVARYGRLEFLIESIERWSRDNVGVPSEGKLASNLREHFDQALRMRSVLVLSRKAPLPQGAMRRRSVDHSQLADVLRSTGLGRMGSRLSQLGL